MNNHLPTSCRCLQTTLERKYFRLPSEKNKKTLKILIRGERKLPREGKSTRNATIRFVRDDNLIVYLLNGYHNTKKA